jgi:hypothetical protein
MTKRGRANHIFKPEFQFGLGGVPLGSEFEVVTDDETTGNGVKYCSSAATIANKRR